MSETMRVLTKRWIGEGSKRLLFEQSGETIDEVLESFRVLVDSGVFPEQDFLLFKVKLKHHKKKGAKQQLYMTCRDNDTFESILEFASPHVDAKPETSVFMTDDSFGIRPKQSAGNIFMKYGDDIELHTGVHLNQIGWHAKN
mmetsp:Transcript_17913/g.22071  ORF Transcript_17913/g.22071 Transcript_17913/m.22071 type:complete len:142 (+) Transcript_17913:425-850(+)